MPWHIWLLLFYMTSCNQNNLTNSFRIIGSNKLSSVKINDRNKDIVNSIGRMRVGCTVAHIGRGYGITAGHCFSRMLVGKKGKNLNCNLERYRMIWGFHKQGINLKSRCQKIL